MLKAILFDLDRTLINSEHFHFKCRNEILAEMGAQSVLLTLKSKKPFALYLSPLTS